MIVNIAKLAAAAVVTAGLWAAADVLAQTAPAPAPPPAPSAGARPTGATLAIPELIERLSREGYSDVGEVERKSEKLYTVKARDAQRRMRELYVDGRTAEVLASEDDDDD